MDKKSQIAFLRAQLEIVERARIENEINLRGLKYINLIGKDQRKVTEAITMTQAERENLDLKIKQYKNLIQEVEDGRFTV